jgi:hypothetical protein
MHNIVLSETGTHSFAAETEGYGSAPAAYFVTVTNTGNQATGALFIGKSGANVDSFTVSKTQVNSLGVNGTDSFTVAPVMGLGEGTYSATITVSGGNNISASFGVSFTVAPAGDAPVYSIGLSETGTHSFAAETEGYGSAPAAYSVTVTNMGNQATGALFIGKSGANAVGFTVSKTQVNSLGVNGTDSFTVAPVTGLGEGTYTTAVIVSGDNGISASFEVSFTVAPAGDASVYSISLSETGTHSFAAVMKGYGSAPAAYSATVLNTGNQATGALNIDLSGTDPWAFTLNTTWISGIAVGGTDSFTAAPVTGLGEGTYTATVIVSGDNGISASFGLSFTVNQGLSANADLGSLSVSGGTLSPAFSADITYYTVTVPNTTNSIEVSAAPEDTAAALYQDPANPVILSVGTNTITVRVTSEDGFYTSYYTIYVTREPSANADLGSLSVSVGTLSPAFSADITDYTVTVPSTTASIEVSAATADTAATLYQEANPVILSAWGPTTINIQVYAEDGTYKNYTVTVHKSAAVTVVIGMADEVIDLTRSTENDLSREAWGYLQLTAPEGYTNYIWRVDGNTSGYYSYWETEISISANDYSYGTHSALLEFEKDGIPFGCEVLFRVVR